VHITGNVAPVLPVRLRSRQRFAAARNLPDQGTLILKKP